MLDTLKCFKLAKLIVFQRIAYYIIGQEFQMKNRNNARISPINRMSKCLLVSEKTILVLI